MKVIIAAGGTGGHLYPGIAIARELLKDRGAEVLFTGTEQGIEARVLPKEGLAVRFITVGKLKGMKLLGTLKTLAALPRSLYQAAGVVRDVKPDVVISVGGYSAGPVAIAAWAAGIPVLIVEPNSYAGLANRIAGRVAHKVVLCFPATDRQHFFSRGKTYLTGPLVRKGIERGNREHALKAFGLEPGRFTVFVMGGSGGAHAINMAMKGAAVLLADMPELQVLHQTGERDVQAVSEGYLAANIKAHVLPYVHDMAGAYAAADLVVARSGATTVAELAVCGKRAILIPFPFAADNHQEYNARSLEALGAAEVILQQDLSSSLLAGAVRNHARSRPAVVQWMANTAAEEIAEICRAYVQKD